MDPELTERDEQFLASYGLTPRSAPPFFTRQPALLAVYTVLSLGAYGWYWMYRNWNAVRIASERPMLPVLRALFAIIYAWPLFKIMLLLGRERGLPDWYPGGLLAVLYLLPNVFLAFTWDPQQELYQNHYLGWLIGLTVLMAGVLLLAQRAAMWNNPRKQADPYDRSSWFEAAFVTFLCILPAVTQLLAR